MRGGACCQRIKPVDISAIVEIVGGLPFVPANVGSANPEKSPCFVVPSGHPLPRDVAEFVAGLGLGGDTRRILFRKLGPRQGMPRHVDRWMRDEADWRRFQVPLVSDPSVVMRWPDDGVEVHLKPGFLYEVRFDRTHEVVNGWDGERIHLQIDQVGATI